MSILVRSQVPDQRAALVIEAVPGSEAAPRSEATRESDARQALAASAGLRILATGAWPDGDVAEAVPPGVAGFIVSSFNPLVAEVARRALSAYSDSAGSAVTAVILVSADGDVTSARSVAQAVDSGGRVGPLMFFQSVPNAIAGYVAAQWALTGPVVAISPVDDALAEGFDVAGLMLADGDADRALLIFVELGTVELGRAELGRAELGRAELGKDDLGQETDRGDGQDMEHDRALALLVERRSPERRLRPERPKELEQ